MPPGDIGDEEVKDNSSTFFEVIPSFFFLGTITLVDFSEASLKLEVVANIEVFSLLLYPCLGFFGLFDSFEFAFTPSLREDLMD